VQPFAIAGIVLLLFYAIWIPVLDGLAAHLAAFFVIAMACHGELARTRPDPRHLTTFYVALSFGGMTGGLFSGLIAPYAFSWVAEYPILAVLAVLCRPFDQEIWKPLERWFWWMAPSYWPRLTVNFWPVAIAAVLILIFSGFADQSFGEDPDLVKFSVWALVGASVVLWRDPPKSAFMVALALVLTWGYPSNENHRETVRSFFGVHKVYDTDDGRFRVFKHGSTIHGAQRLETEDGGLPTGRPIPITYYHDNSAMNRAIEAVRARKGAPLHVAVIGLGIGTLACRIADGETWRFFEIDPAVIEIARDPKRFSFLSSCAPNLPIVLGDARLTFAAEPDQSYDLIIMDAYSSDAIPVHLATAEAMAIYKSKLAPHGVVMMHISNRYLELRSVVGGIAAANNLKTWIWDRQIEESKDIDYIFSSDVAIAAESAVDIGALADDGRWVLTPPNPAVRTWTDDYSNIAGAIWRKHAK
jgi:hypothetical protein